MSHVPTKEHIKVVDYDPNWPLAFQEISAVIANALGSLHLRIEHVGSTSVPNLAAKPIIDIDVVIGSYNLLPEVITRLSTLGYTHQGELGVKGREAFKRTGTHVPHDASRRSWMSHHLYVCPIDSPELARHLAFTHYLKENPPAAVAYGRLKKDLAQRLGHDREAYTEAKSEFITHILQKATCCSP